jgi:hypothetical protein
VQQSLMDGKDSHGYLFHNACMRNHRALNWGHCHCSSGLAGEPN